MPSTLDLLLGDSSQMQHPRFRSERDVFGTMRVLPLELSVLTVSVSPLPPGPWKQSTPLPSPRQKLERTGHKPYHACGRRGKTKIS